MNASMLDLPQRSRRSHRWVAAALLTLFGIASANATDFDHSHSAWTTLLQAHVVEQRGGVSTVVRYADLARDRQALARYLATLSAVALADYQAWRKSRQLAFLINAYNAFTVDLVLTRYPDLKSIRDFGSLFSSPWKKAFIPLLGETISLDDIEHGRIRKPGAFDDPRIHAAVNCASIGCPALRREAFVAERLDAQLDDAMERFLSDRTRNRYDATGNRLEVSSIFDWYGKDFELGHRGYEALPTLFARHANRLADDPEHQTVIRAGRYRLVFLPYDWALNDAE